MDQMIASTENHSRPLTIYYRGIPIRSFEGDTIATALLRHGIREFSRSFKYHRPRGPFCLSGKCSRCVMTVDGRPNVRTCQTLVRAGMRVEPQASIKWDPLALTDRLAPIFPVGFYYKHFYRPNWIWPLTLKALRHSSGGSPRIRAELQHSRFEHVNLHPDVLVIGGGLAGISAAAIAGKYGVRVILVDENESVGSGCIYDKQEARIIGQLLAELNKMENVSIITKCVASAVYPDGLIVAVKSDSAQIPYEETVFLLRPRATVFATGALSNPLVFSGNDRPGIFLPEAAHKMIRYRVTPPGKKVVVAGGDDFCISTALMLSLNGINIIGVADYRKQAPTADLLNELLNRGIPFFPQHVPVATEYGTKLKGIWIENIRTSQAIYLGADTVFVSAGRTGRWKLLRTAGVSLTYNAEKDTCVAEKMPRGYYAAGRVLGASCTDEIEAQGRLAGANALVGLGVDANEDLKDAAQKLKELNSTNKVASQPVKSLEPGKAFVCFCHDVTLKDVRDASKEGFNQVESSKRYTTATMGICQGAMCLSNFTRGLARATPQGQSRLSFPTSRTPATPISLGAFAGVHMDQPRLSPLHEIQMGHGGRPVRTGPWIRIDHFGDPEAESLAVHNTAGLADVSTLGKFRVFGPDATNLLDRVYTRNIKDLSNTQILYSPACNEEGAVFDDGIIILKGEDDFYLTSSTARAPLMREWFERWLREEKWKVWIADLTDNFCAMNLAGPKSRLILSRVVDTEISNESLPYMNWTQVRIAGTNCMIFRMGFLGELSYEIHVPSSYGTHVWELLMQEGKPEGLRPVGLETQFICRLEKGHAIPGLDIDGNTTLFEAGFGWAWEKAKAEITVGGPVLAHLEEKPLRQKVVGFALDRRVPIKEGYLVVEGSRKLGHVTSVRYSPLLKKVIGLALVKQDRSGSEQDKITIYGDDRRYQAELVTPPFYDPEGKGLRL